MIGPSRMILAPAILLSLCGGTSVTQQYEAASSAQDLVEAAVQNELNRSDTIDIRWKYLSHKEAERQQRSAFLKKVEEFPDKQRDGSSEMRNLAERLKELPVYAGFQVMERVGISDALDDATDAVFANLRRSAIPAEDAQFLYRAGIADPELEITIMIEYARRNIRVSRGSLSEDLRKIGDLNREMAERVHRTSNEFGKAAAAAVPPKKRKLLNGIGKILGGAIAGTGNVLLLAGTIVAPNPATGYGAIASSALAVAGILQGAGDLRGE